MAGYRLAGDPPGTWDSALTPGMVTSVRRLGSPRSSPDGTTVAYTQSYDGKTHLYTVPSAGGPSRQLSTDQPISGGNYAWTPDSQAIVYASSGNLWSVPAEGGRVRQLTEGPGRLLMPSISPDGHFIACVVDRGEHVDVGVVPLSGTEDTTWPSRISSGNDPALDPQWAPNGSSLFWMSYPSRQMPWDASSIVACSLQEVAKNQHVVVAQEGFAHTEPRVSPDGRFVAYLSDRTGWLNLWLHDTVSGDDRPLGAEECEHGHPFWPFDVRDLCWSPDGESIAHLQVRNGRIGVALVAIQPGERRVLTDIPGVHSQLSWCGPNSIVCAFTAPHIPSQIVRIDVRTGERVVLVDGAPAGITAVQPKHVTFLASDGQTAYGLLTVPDRPAQESGYPALVLFHGGPTDQAVEAWNGPLHYFVGRGWAVLQLNYRGSTGYGKQYRDALNGMWGEGELRDALGSLDYLTQCGNIDLQRVVAWGGSSGGYDVLYCLTHAPGRFAAGVCLYGISDLISLSETTHAFERYYNDTLVGPLPQAWRRQHDLSPINHVQHVQDPVLLLHGGKDDSVPLDQAERFVDALRRGGKEVEFHLYPDEGHGWSRTATVADYLQRMDEFLHANVLCRGPVD